MPLHQSLAALPPLPLMAMLASDQAPNPELSFLIVARGAHYIT